MRKLIFIIALLLLLTGCNSSTDPVTHSIPGDADDGDSAAHVFETEGVSIAMHEEAEPVLQGLGDALEYFEAESCAFQGMEKVYTYNGFELHTYEDDGTDYVAAIIFLDDSVSTKEGLYLFADFKAVLDAYGDEYTRINDMYYYDLNGSRLSFFVEDDEVTSIEYMAITE